MVRGTGKREISKGRDGMSGFKIEGVEKGRGRRVTIERKTPQIK
jgi:hypothetical protein